MNDIRTEVDHDFENKIKRLLNESVDADLGAQRTPPPFKSADDSTRRRLAWRLPVTLAAAALLAVAVAGGATTLVLHQNRQAVPAQTTSAKPTPPPGHSVMLDGARIQLPADWEARDYSGYLDKDSGSLYQKPWCLTPKSFPTSTDPGACPIVLGQIDPDSNAIDVDIAGGLASNPSFCRNTDLTFGHDERQFGGRAAEWRQWRFTCTNGKATALEQYVVPTLPGFVLYSESTDPQVNQAMTSIAAGSELPVENKGIRLMDRGIVKKIEQTDNGVRITLDRVIMDSDGNSTINPDPATYTYLVPDDVIDQSQIKQGTVVTLTSDGKTVNSIYPS